jgi:hypothetical protein
VSTTAAAAWAELVGEHYRKRCVLSLAGEVVEGVYAGADLAGLVAELGGVAQADTLARRSTWEPVNLAAVLAGEVAQVEPTLLARSDGALLLYPGKVHSFAAESEAGKSWLALLACRQAVEAGAHVLYLDFEDSAGGVVERLLALGAHPDVLLDRFHYVRPNDPIDAAARLRVLQILEAWPIALAVIDGVTEAMVISGWSISDNDDVARFYTALPRLCAREGAAVVLIDHVVKDRDQRGRYAIGGQHKLAGIDGAAYALEVLVPFGRGRAGKSKLIVQKDRPGFVRSIAVGGRILGEFHLRSSEAGAVAEVTPPAELGDTFRPTVLMERISRTLELATEPMTLRQLRTVVHGNHQAKDTALQTLIAEGYVATRPAARGAVLHTSERPFRADETTEPRVQDDQF